MNGGDLLAGWMDGGSGSGRTREPEPVLGRMRDPLRLERSRWFGPMIVHRWGKS